MGKTRRGKKKMAAPSGTKKITLDPYVLVLFVERVFAEPERKDDSDDAKRSVKKEGKRSEPNLN